MAESTESPSLHPRKISFNRADNGDFASNKITNGLIRAKMDQKGLTLDSKEQKMIIFGPKIPSLFKKKWWNWGFPPPPLQKLLLVYLGVFDQLLIVNFKYKTEVASHRSE